MIDKISPFLINNLQNQYQDAKNVLPVLLAIVEDLEILEQAFVFKGVFCPLIEHRCPNLLSGDGVGLNMSYAQRSNQFYMIGRRIIKNCRIIIYLTPVNHLPQVTKICNNIIVFLLNPVSGSSASYLQIETTRLMSDSNHDFNQMILGLRMHHTELNDIIPKELPSLAYTSIKSLIFKIVLFIFLVMVAYSSFNTIVGLLRSFYA